MKLISEIYAHYKIMPSLQLHMWRVAAVAAMIVDHFDRPLERQEIVSACLLHDMGNILKFDLEKFPEFLQPEGLEYWQKVKTEFEEKYGNKVIDATIKIAQEIDVSARTLELINAIGFEEIDSATTGSDFAAKICEYSDLRVSPMGITSMADRWHDLEARYKHRHNLPEEQTKLCDYIDLSFTIEKDIFTHCTIQPYQITEASAGDTIASLHDFVVS